jgi:hypothetical protein
VFYDAQRDGGVVDVMHLVAVSQCVAVNVQHCTNRIARQDEIT